MIGGGELRARLGQLARSRRGGGIGAVESPSGTRELDAETSPVGAARRRSQDARSPHAVGVEAYLPGGEWRDEGGAVYVHERLRS